MGTLSHAAETSRLRRAHLIGAAGAGMRSLGRVLRQQGWSVTGSDLTVAPGDANVIVGHAPNNVPDDVELVVASDAVPPDNCERLRAIELGTPPISYAEMLGRLAADRFTLAIAGTHGKSTVAAMATHVLQVCGRQPVAIFGAEPLSPSQTSDATPWDGPPSPLIVEACEYRRNFLHIPFDAAVITGIEHDHFDCYQAKESLEEAFAQFAHSARPGGLLLAAGDCPATLRATDGLARETFGWTTHYDWRLHTVSSQRGCYRATIDYRGSPACRLRLDMLGRHNLINALAAVALVARLDVPPSAAAAALESFSGLRRRLELVHAHHGIRFYDDYAHHPTEVAAGLATLRRLAAGHRLWCVFQPHQASRTARLLNEFARSLQIADRILVDEIFRAREPAPCPGEVSAADLARQIRSLGADAQHIPRSGPGPRHGRIADGLFRAILQGELTPGDVVVTMGAGDIGNVIHDFSQRFRKNRQAG